MKKLLYSALSIALMSAAMVGCKDDSTTGGDGPAAKGPDIAFQTNTGTFSGYTFSDDQVEVKTPIKIGVKLSHTENLKSTKMTVKFNNQPEVTIKDSAINGSTKTFAMDFFYTLPADAGTYIFTAYATDSKATTSKASIKITAYGEIGTVSDSAVVYSLKATATNHFSAFDLINNIAITASGSANTAQRDIVDASTTNSLSGIWKSGNGTEFIIGNKLNGKVYSQFKSQADIQEAWDKTSGKSTTISGVDAGMLIIAKTNNGGSTKYFLIGINDAIDDTGADNDRYEFSYSY
jgi:hypothetical protein